MKGGFYLNSQRDTSVWGSSILTSKCLVLMSSDQTSEFHWNRSLYVSGKLPTYPSPKSTSTLTEKRWLRVGVGGQFPRNIWWSRNWKPRQVVSRRICFGIQLRSHENFLYLSVTNKIFQKYHFRLLKLRPAKQFFYRLTPYNFLKS